MATEHIGRAGWRMVLLASLGGTLVFGGLLTFTARSDCHALEVMSSNRPAYRNGPD